MNFAKYKRYSTIKLENREWPSKEIEKAPIWCSVDLRDGNQALPMPMTVEKKLSLYKLIRKIGFKEIEVGFPSASNTEFNFIREIIENNMVDDVAIQVLTQSRAHLIDRTFEAIQGSKKAIVHLYNSTSVQQRKVVFGKSKEEIIKIAIEGAKRIKELAAQSDADIYYEYSPESFTGTEMEYALEICEAVLDVWEPTPERKVVINLPATVEMATPNVYADQIEWFHKNLKRRDSIILSVHAHNDRGTSVAATELAILAGADRVEGTLFGNGERTGNVDLITLAMNLFSQGIDPELNMEDLSTIIKVYEDCTGMNVHERHPYAGELVYTAFSGSHQDAIRKGLIAYNQEKPEYWEVPYLPIDPSDVGREYEAIIRINSQSGKGGVAYIMENEFGYHIPKAMHPEFGAVIKLKSDDYGRELSPVEIYDAFKDTYLKEGSINLKKYSVESADDIVSIKAVIDVKGEEKSIQGKGNGPISAFFDALKQVEIKEYTFVTYEEHALSSGEDAEAVAYIELKNKTGEFFGVGKDRNTTTASFKAIISAINRTY